MRFEKWQALGNDYVIVEADRLPWPLTAARVRALCAPHTGVGSDGVLLLARDEDPRSVAHLRIFNPDGSEAELSGNGAREAIVYLRRAGWTDDTQFQIRTAAGPIRPTITGPTTCTVDMGRAALSSRDFPAGGADGRGTVQAGGRSWIFQHVSVGNPQCAIAMTDPAELDALELVEFGPEIERSPLFPNRTNVSWFAPLEHGVIRARIFERGVGETLSSGTGACGAAVAHVLAARRGAAGTARPGTAGAADADAPGGDATSVTVRLDGGELEVQVSEDLGLQLSGWAVPVYAAELSDELVAALGDINE